LHVACLGLSKIKFPAPELARWFKLDMGEQRYTGCHRHALIVQYVCGTETFFACVCSLPTYRMLRPWSRRIPETAKKIIQADPSAEDGATSSIVHTHVLSQCQSCMPWLACYAHESEMSRLRGVGVDVCARVTVLVYSVES